MSNLEHARAEKVIWQGEEAVLLAAGGFEALLVPGIGGNLIELKDVKRGLDILRKPDNIDAFRERPQVYGIPILFPPNRIKGGQFTVGGRTYNFPINEPRGKKNHIHGFLRTRPWKVAEMKTTEDHKAVVEILFKNDADSDFFHNYPHEFEFRIVYELSDAGLSQRISILNQSDLEMPMGLGFHTAFKIPFYSRGNPDDYRLRVSVGQMWEIDADILPTGRILPLNDTGKSLRSEGMKPQGKAVEIHCTAEPIKLNGQDFNGAIIEDRSNGLCVIYQAGKSFKHWIVWNETGDKGFICPEPQTWVINAPNIDLPDEITGFRLLQPGEVWEDNCRIFVEELADLNVEV